VHARAPGRSPPGGRAPSPSRPRRAATGDRVRFAHRHPPAPLHGAAPPPDLTSGWPAGAGGLRGIFAWADRRPTHRRGRPRAPTTRRATTTRRRRAAEGPRRARGRRPCACRAARTACNVRGSALARRARACRAARAMHPGAIEAGCARRERLQPGQSHTTQWAASRGRGCGSRPRSRPGIYSCGRACAGCLKPCHARCIKAAALGRFPLGLGIDGGARVEHAHIGRIAGPAWRVQGLRFAGEAMQLWRSAYMGISKDPGCVTHGVPHNTWPWARHTRNLLHTPSPGPAHAAAQHALVTYLSYTHRLFVPFACCIPPCCFGGAVRVTLPFLHLVT
jgi:hypothetical protein